MNCYLHPASVSSILRELLEHLRLHQELETKSEIKVKPTVLKGYEVMARMFAVRNTLLKFAVRAEPEIGTIEPTISGYNAAHA